MKKSGSPIQQGHVPLVVLLGFLGSGKTTLLNRLLAARPPHMRVGILVNEWGHVNVDGKLVRPGQEDEIIELSGGQVFCSCIAGSFMDACMKLLDADPDILLVEASGLARPAAMKDIMEGIVRRSSGRIVQGSVLCVVDAARFSQILKVAAATKEQILSSDVVVCSKTDLASTEEKARTLSKIRELVPLLPLLDSRSDKDMEKCWNRYFKEWKTHAGKSGFRKTGWGAKGRPVTVTLHPKKTLDEEKLRLFLDKILPSVLRVKGVLRVRTAEEEEKNLLVEIAGNRVSLQPTDTQTTPLIIIGYEGNGLASIVHSHWKSLDKG